MISTPNKSNYSDINNYKNEFHVKEFYLDEFKEFINTNFNYNRYLIQNNEIMSFIYDDCNSIVYKDNYDEKACKYIIAICSDQDFDVHYKGIMKCYTGKKLQELYQRILVLQEEEESRNIHIAKLDNIIEENISLLKEKDNTIQELQSLLMKQEEEMNSKVADLDIVIRNKNSELNMILNSDGWKVLSKYYKVRDKLLPPESKRRFFIKLLKRFVSNPDVYLKKVNIENIRKLKYYLNTEGLSNLDSRLDAFEDKNGNSKDSVLQVNSLENFKELSEYPFLQVPISDNPLVSIVIPVYNQFDYTYNCIKSIINNTKDINYEIILADDNSNDLTQNISSVINGLKIIRNTENKRFLLNCNNAAQFARGKYIHFLNNDTQVQENWLSSLVELIEKDNEIGMVGSKLVYPDGKLQEAGGILWKDGSAWNYGNGSDPNLPEFNYVKEADYISGASILIRSELWKKLGGFDELFVPAYCEDSDLAFSVRKAGYKVVYQPRSVVVHFEGISNGKDVTSGLKAYQVENSRKFFSKWKEVLEKDHFPNAVNVFQARDKSSSNKCVVFIDHYVPTYDKDAGSRTVFEYLKLLVKNGYNIKFLGDNFYRSEPYTTVLQQLGIEVLYGKYYADNWKEWFTNNADAIDYIFLNRPHISIKYIDFLKKFKNIKIAYYGHDLHFLREKREYQLTGNKECLKESERWREIEMALLEKADVAYYPSNIEVATIKGINERLNVNVLTPYIFPHIDCKEYDFKNKADIMFIGGFTHKPNVDAVLWFHADIWPIVKKSLPDLKIYILGSNPPDSIKQLNSSDFVVKGFVTDDELEEFYKKCKLSVVPLRYGAGIKGKVIEALAHQMPVLTTSVGAEGIDSTEDILFIKDKAMEFANCLIDLYDNESKLTKSAKNGINYINENYSESSAMKSLSNLF